MEDDKIFGSGFHIPDPNLVHGHSYIVTIWSTKTQSPNQLLDILWPKWSKSIVSLYICWISILTLSQPMVSLGLFKYVLVYKPYIGFIVTQMLNINMPPSRTFSLWMWNVKPNHVNIYVCSLLHASTHYSIITHHRTTLTRII